MNNDLISRSAVIDRLKAKVCNDCYVPESGGKCGGCFIRAALDMIEDVAAVDAVEVVRCRDCIRWTPLRNFVEIGNCNRAVSTCTPGSFFCADGAKMDAEVQT